MPNTEPDLSSQKRGESQESTNIVSKQRPTDNNFVSKTEVSAAVMQSEHQMKLDTYIHLVSDDDVQNAAGSNQREETKETRKKTQEKRDLLIGSNKEETLRGVPKHTSLLVYRIDQKKTAEEMKSILKPHFTEIY
ncbi:hypothetical protein JTB14_021146 [Gonioctena quinquepunctata]|nr:hypothetical protein JTB14_021146 [Gonioctena quinquepunctata]